MARPHRTAAPFHVLFFLGAEVVEAKRRAPEETRADGEVVDRIARNALCEGRRAVRYIVSS